MKRAAIPERQPINDGVTGTILQWRGRDQAVVIPPTTDADLVDTSIRPLASGTLTVRYAVRMLGKPHIAIIPSLIVVDAQTILTGEEAWLFLTKRSNLHPRAEVFGFRNDGRDDMILVKLLDLMEPIQVLVFSSGGDVLPTATPTALIAPPDVPDSLVPSRLRGYLTPYPTIAAWHAAMNTSSSDNK